VHERFWNVPHEHDIVSQHDILSWADAMEFLLIGALPERRTA
jgi:hypothetical protein